jgi:hypothetical protein
VSEILCFLEAHNGAITALATVLIAAFTIVLAVVSNRQARLIEDQARIARNEFIVTHRPKIIVRAFQMLNPDAGVGVAPRVIFIAHNIGDSPARIIEVRSATLVQDINANLPNDLGFPFLENFHVTLVSGQKEVFPINGADPFVENEAMEIFARRSMLLCLGIVAYLDGAGTRRETGFCRRFMSDAREWSTLRDSEYEYAY